MNESLIPILCKRCFQLACYGEPSWKDEIEFHVYCKNCIQITPLCETKEKEGITNG